MGDDFHVGVMDGRHGLYFLRSLQNYDDMALQSMSNQILVNFTSTENEKLRACEIVMLSHHISSPSAMFMGDSRVIDFVHCDMNFA